MKILYDYQIFYDQEYGGPSRYFFHLAKELIEKEDLKICAPLYINNYLSDLPKNNVYGIKILNRIVKNVPYKIRLILNKLFIDPLNKKISENFVKKYKPDIIHQTYFNSYKKSDIPTVLTVYDLIHEKTQRDTQGLSKSKLLKNAKKIICISHKTKKDLLKYHKVKKKILKLYIWV